MKKILQEYQCLVNKIDYNEWEGSSKSASVAMIATYFFQLRIIAVISW